ncbi:MAG: electron transfer flavoprotein subunit alpha/FixB family protein [Actinobacteria bacterium]|nr:electron transfer flavoprotein subunit alpha/FixB family protein [Actinomycetota bacterium]
MILVFVEHEAGVPLATSLESLTLGRRLSKVMGLPLHASVAGDGARGVAGALGAYGASAVHAVEDPRIADYAPTAWARALAQVAEAGDARVALAAATDRGSEVMAHVAAIAGLPLAASCVAVAAGDPFVVTRQRFGGSLLEDARIDAGLKLLTVAPYAVPPEEVEPAVEPEIRTVAPDLMEGDLRVRLTGREAADDGRVSLSDARVVVGGGRGVGSADGFRSLEELAGLLGGAVGVSRAVTSLGWRPHAEQVGQTGARIAPDLYIACGISGAIQHMVGCKGAKRILAINTDAEAPIMAKADYAVVGDLRGVLAAVIEEIRRLGSS